VSKLRVQKGKADPVEVAGDMIVTKTDLSFSPDSKYLLWAQKDPQTNLYDLWIADLETLCPQRLPPIPGQERRYPVLSPDMKWLTFTMIDKKRSRIARMGFTPPAGPCPATP
jgi:Tol biopolymer transport system component